MLNVRLKLCRNHGREEQQHAQLNTLWATDAMRNAHRQTGRIIGAFLSMPYANQWIIQGVRSEVFFPISATNPEAPPFFFLPSSLIQAQTPGGRLKSSWQHKLAANTKAEPSAQHDQIMRRRERSRTQQNLNSSYAWFFYGEFQHNGLFKPIPNLFILTSTFPCWSGMLQQ